MSKFRCKALGKMYRLQLKDYWRKVEARVERQREQISAQKAKPKAIAHHRAKEIAAGQERLRRLTPQEFAIARQDYFEWFASNFRGYKAYFWIELADAKLKRSYSRATDRGASLSSGGGADAEEDSYDESTGPTAVGALRRSENFLSKQDWNNRGMRVRTLGLDATDADWALLARIEAKSPGRKVGRPRNGKRRMKKWKTPQVWLRSTIKIIGMRGKAA